MSRADKVALLLSLTAFVLVGVISSLVFENIPHIEDEMTYVWQANVHSRFQLGVPTPDCPKCFLVPFVIENGDFRYSKYPPGWPAALSVGIKLNGRDYVNPLLAALCVWLMYRLTAKFLKPWTAVLSTFLLVSSPFFLMNAGSLLSHTWSLFLALTFIISWLDSWEENKTVPVWMRVMTSAIALGLLILTRPMTAFSVSIPFAVHGFFLWLKGANSHRKWLARFVYIIGLFIAAYLTWQYALTGSLTTNPYVLYWPYDRIGFGPNVGLNPDGHTIKHAVDNTLFSLSYGSSDLFGWQGLSWLFFLPGIIALRKKPQALLVSGVLLSIILIYALYWIGSWILGPRYYYEGLISAVLLTCAGIEWLITKTHPRLNLRFGNRHINIQKVVIGLIVTILISLNIVNYLPKRLTGLRGLYGITASQLTFLQSDAVQKLAPALIIIHPQDNWLEYGALLDISSPFLDSPIVIAYNRGSELNKLAGDYLSDRQVLHYYPTMYPETLYITPFPSVQTDSQN